MRTNSSPVSTGVTKGQIPSITVEWLLTDAAVRARTGMGGRDRWHQPSRFPIPALAVPGAWRGSRAGEGRGVAAIPLSVSISFGFSALFGSFLQGEQWYPTSRAGPEPHLAPQVPKPTPGA